MLAFKVFTILCIFAFSSAIKLEVEVDGSSEVAQQQLQRIHRQTRHMKYGQCWTKALEKLEYGCRDLTDEVQRRIAYAFARCHLQSAGRDIPECKLHQPVSLCTNEDVLKDSAFSTYTEFFTHTQQMCFHLQSQVWHEATEHTISKLADNSAEVANTLEESSLIAREMVQRQNISLQNQEELLKNERMIRVNMRKSVVDAQRSHKETKAIIREQRELFGEVFDRVAALQKTVLGEFTSIYTFGFYIGTSLLAYILTSTPRTSSARVWLFVLITVNFFTEKAVVNYHLAPGSTDQHMFVNNAVLPETVYHDMWLCRKIYCALASLLMVVCIFRYKDYNKINHSLLTEIKRQNQELQDLLKEQNTIHSASFNGFSTSSKNLDVCKVSTTTLLNDHKHDDIELNNTKVSSVNGSFIDALSSQIDISSACPYDSGDDTTYVADDTGSESSFSSYASGSSMFRGSVSTRITSFRRSSTPSGSSRRSSVSSTTSFLEALNESVVEAEGVIVGGHNLRRRKSINYKASTAQKESVDDFIGSMAKLTTKRNHLLKHKS